MNKYQEALNNITFDILNCGNCDGDNDKIICKTKCIKFNDIYTLQKLVDKEKPEKLTYSYDGYADGYPVIDYAECPSCGSYFDYQYEDHYKYCPDCGQKLDWNVDE